MKEHGQELVYKKKYIKTTWIVNENKFYVLFCQLLSKKVNAKETLIGKRI